jgi:hypothetical protein
MINWKRVSNDLHDRLVQIAGVLDQTRGVRHSLEASETSLRIHALPTRSGGRGSGMAVPLVNKVIKDATVALTRLIPGSLGLPNWSMVIWPLSTQACS